MSDQSASQSIEELEARCTDKEVRWAYEYVNCLNKTKAAVRAKYDGDYNALRKIGSENSRKPHIRALVNALTPEILETDIVAAITDIAFNSSLDDYTTIGRRGLPKIDIKKAEERGKMHLAKSYSRGPKGERIELYDRLAALRLLAQLKGMLVERQDITSGGEKIQADNGQFNRAISTLADAIRETISGANSDGQGAVDAAEQTPMAGPAEPGG